MIWDYTCPDSLVPSHLRITGAMARSAAEVAEFNSLCFIVACEDSVTGAIPWPERETRIFQIW